MVLTEGQQQALRWGGFVMFVLANAALLLSEQSTPSGTQVQNAKVISVVCETYLATHTPYDVPPPHCEQELRYLIRRINHTLKEIEDARHDSMAVPKISPTNEDSNPNPEQ